MTKEAVFVFLSLVLLLIGLGSAVAFLIYLGIALFGVSTIYFAIVRGRSHD